MPDISIIIPVKNGASTISSCLRGIFSQEVSCSFEVIIIDSSSTDGTLEILQKYPIRLYSIPSTEFNHGETRNRGVELAKGRFIVMTVQDATPVDIHWIAKMLKHFDDPMVAGVCGKQRVPEEADKNPLDWFRPISKLDIKKVSFPDTQAFLDLPGERQRALCGWDNVTAMYRKDVLIQLPFQSVSFAEDTLWAKDALENGYSIVYDSFAQVYHYHHESFSFAFRRNYTVQYHFFKHFNFARHSGGLLMPLVKSIYRLSKEKSCSLFEKIKWSFYNIKIILASWVSIQFFFVVLKISGREGIEKSHGFFCGKPPQSVNSRTPVSSLKNQ